MLIPLAALSPEPYPCINDYLSILAQCNLKPLQWPWRRTLDVKLIRCEAAAMTGAFEFSFCCKPVRGTTQMGAFCLDYVQSVNLPYNPYPELFLKSFAYS